jgi:hypothetical protein
MLGIALLSRSSPFLEPVDRYVDDLFWIDWAEISAESTSLLVEFIDLLGLRLDPDKSEIPSIQLEVLGSHVHLVQAHDHLSIHTSVDAAKSSFWLTDLAEWDPSSPSSWYEKLAGKLAFACFSSYGRSARSMLNSIYRAASSQSFDPLDLRLELRWWCHQLSVRRVRKVRFDLNEASPFLVYSDAEGNGDLGAFWAHEGQFFFGNWGTASRIKNCLYPRKTQIHAYEAVAAFWALMSCPVVGRKVISLIDNLAVSYNIHKGRSAASDVNRIIHAVYRAADQRSLELHVWWIPTKSNLSDDPSRGREAVAGSRIHSKANLSILYHSLQAILKKALYQDPFC